MASKKEASRSEKVRPVKIQVGFEGQPDPKIRVEAYAFDSRGNFLASAPVADGQATLALSEEQARRARLYLAPALVEGRPQVTPSLALMERLNAYEATGSLASGAVIDIGRLPEFHWRWWLWCSCRVRGQVVRPVEAGGTVQDLPVCHVRVHVCEVDRIFWLLPRLRDVEIFRLRDDLVEALERPVPLTLPDPPPFRFDPAVADPSPANLAEMIKGQLPERPAELAEAGLTLGGSEVAFNPQPEPPATGAFLQRAASIQALPLTTRSALSSTSATVVRAALLDNVRLIIPYLCLWPWFYQRLRCDELAVVETDGQGRFETTIWYLCFGDHPDLYFWVEAMIGGVWTMVYRPPMACNTWWNYPCGSSVTLRVTDPRVPVCQEPDDLPGKQVAVLSIGNEVSISEITASGLTTGGQPFGGVLEPHVEFSRTALRAAGVDHYRWSYRRLTLADGSAAGDGWHAMDRRVIRHYGLIENTPPDFPFSFPAYTLGPDPAFPGQNLFEIQPVDVAEVVTPPADADLQGWASIDAREDSAAAFFETHKLEGGNAAAAAGLYELKLELFDSTGALVNWTDRGIELKEANVSAPFGNGTASTTVAPAAHRLEVGGDLFGFRLTLRVDNNPCEAFIHSVSGNAEVEVDENCGFLEYEDQHAAQIAVRFRAHHPHGFARFWFRVHRGPSIQVLAASAPPSGSAAVESPNVNGFLRHAATSTFSKTLSAHTLLTDNKTPGSPDCPSAAFAETLHVGALATDGWNTLTHLDANAAPKAFALAKKPSP